MYKDSTLQRGSVLGVMRPIWHKTTESEERLKWLNKMIGKRLFVREIEAFLKATSSKFRSEESIIKEEERKVLMDIMILKRNDERRLLRELKREKESLRRQVQMNFGKEKCYNLIVKKLRREIKVKREQLKDKYQKKLEHLETSRERKKQYQVK